MKQARLSSVFVAVVLLAAGMIAGAQDTRKVARIGYLDASNKTGSATLLNEFQKKLGSIGCSEGKNLTIEYRFAEQEIGRLPELARELIRLNVDLTPKVWRYSRTRCLGLTGLVLCR